MDTPTAVGLYPYLLSKAAISSAFISRLMGPKLEVPSVSAGGAVEDPAAWICTLTFGYCFLKSSAHRVIRLASVSEPTLLMLPETPLALAYSGNAGSTPAARTAVDRIIAAVAVVSLANCMLMGIVTPWKIVSWAVWRRHVTDVLTACYKCATGVYPDAGPATRRGSAWRIMRAAGKWQVNVLPLPGSLWISSVAS